MKTELHPLYFAAQTRALDRLVISAGVTGFELMQRAAASTFQHILKTWPDVKRLIVFCGLGNNGGDGYLIAQLAYQQGFQVKVYQLGNVEKQTGDALAARLEMQSSGLKTQAYKKNSPLQTALIVDALLGTGLTRVVDGLWLSAIQSINASSAKILAVDIPSGLQADTGAKMGDAIIADSTVTFIGRKQGLYTGDGKACSGRVQFESLNIPTALYEKIETQTFLLPEILGPSLFPPRQVNSHKGIHGHVLIIGGAPGMNGAVILAARAALRSGCGLVSVATHPDHVISINQCQPEIMSHGVSSDKELARLIMLADVIVFGPGAGQSSWAEALFERVMKTEKPLILDADGLNLLVKKPRKKNNWVLTPHPGEVGRLLACAVSDVQTNRFQAITTLQQQYGGVCLLKGAGTLVYDGQQLHLCSAGNPGMASAGMGDILSGILGSLIAQNTVKNPSVFERVSFGVALHSCAGDAAAKEGGEKGLLATDLLPHIRRLMNA